MELSREYKVFEQIAVKEGVTVEHVLKEIELAIDIAFGNPDPNVQKLWSSIPCKKSKPTPEELVRYFCNKGLNNFLVLILHFNKN